MRSLHRLVAVVAGDNVALDVWRPGTLGFSKSQRTIVNDELVRSHQTAAAKFSVVFAFIALLVLSILSFNQLALASWTLPAITSAIVVATGLFFAVLQLRYEMAGYE